MLWKERVWILCLVVPLAPSCSRNIDVEEKGKVVEHFSLEGFRDHQELYCKRLTDELNKPVHWHVLIDNSKSFGYSHERERREQVVEVVRALPLEPGDHLTFNTFGGDFQQGRYTLNIQSSHLTFNGARQPLSRSLLGPLLTDADQRNPQSRTDFLHLVKTMSTHPQDTSHRLYFIVLTDGWNEPEGPAPHQPLFPSKSPEKTPFLLALERFTEPSICLARGLHFLLDTSHVEPHRKGAIESDWYAGQRFLDKIRAIATKPVDRPWERHFIPDITWLSSGESNLGLDDRIRQSLDRSTGIFACLTTSPPDHQMAATGSWPTATGSIKPPCSLVLDHPGSKQTNTDRNRNGKIVSNYTLHALDKLLSDNTDIKLPLLFLARGEAQRTIRVRLFSMEDRGPSFPFFGEDTSLRSLATGNGNGTRWTLLNASVPLPVAESDREKNDLPWRAEVDFPDHGISFLHFEVTAGPAEQRSLIELLTALWERASGYLTLHGRGAALLAFILACLASLIGRMTRNRTWVRFKFNGKDVEIEPGPGNKRSKEKEDHRQVPWKEMHLAQQLRHRVEEGTARLVLRTAGPSIRMEELEEDESGSKLPSKRRKATSGKIKPGTIDIDITPFIDALYHVAYYLDLEGRPLPKGSHYRLINFGEVIGSVILPRRTWQPFFTADSRVVPMGYRWREEIRLQKFDADWKPNGDSRHVVETILDERPLRFLGKSIATLFLYAAFCCAAFAICHGLDEFGHAAWVPYLAIPLAAVGLATKARTFYASSLVVESKPVGSRVDPADTEHPEQPQILAFKRLRSILLSASLALALYVSFLSQGSVDRVGMTLLAAMGVVFGAVYWDDLRDWVLRRRVERRMPYGPLDIILEFFFLRSPV